jgi:hypothetical protein
VSHLFLKKIINNKNSLVGSSVIIGTDNYCAKKAPKFVIILKLII